MGKGKTSVITPLTIANIMTTNKNIKHVFILMPQHLVKQSVNILLKYSILFMGIRIIRFKYEISNDDYNIMTREKL